MNERTIELIISFILSVIIVYMILGLIIWMIRAMEKDCAIRQLDYVWPLSRLHCKVEK